MDSKSYEYRDQLIQIQTVYPNYPFILSLKYKLEALVFFKFITLETLGGIWSDAYYF
jgi:hypothetical protein